MAVLSKTEIAALSTEERLALIDEPWECLEAPVAAALGDAPPISSWQREVLDERLLDLEIHPQDQLSLVESRRQSLL